MKSEAMSRVLAVLQAYPMPSTLEIGDLARVAGVRDYVRRLRGKGYQIETIDSWHDGVRIVRYRLVEAQAAPAVGGGAV